MNETAFQNSGPAAGAEYTIYVFDKQQDPESGRACRWTRHCKLENFDMARKRALVLFRSGRYQKVEIKQKLFDRKQQRHVDVTLKVIEANENLPLLRRLLSRLRGI